MCYNSKRIMILKTEMIKEPELGLILDFYRAGLGLV